MRIKRNQLFNGNTPNNTSVGKRIRKTSKRGVVVKNTDILSEARDLFSKLENLSIDSKIAIANDIKIELFKISSMSSEPVDCVRWIKFDRVHANDYNPNAVAPPEMELLETSIWEDGYTQPIVTYYDKDNDSYIVVDGFHRYLTLKNSERIFERNNGMLPIVVIDKQISDRMASTIRHNRARGSHNIELMSTIVAELVEMGKGDRWICQHIGMSIDELLRLKQITGVAALFENTDFSDSWEADSDNNNFDTDDYKEQSE